MWLSYCTKVFTYTVLGMYPGAWLRVYFYPVTMCTRCHALWYKVGYSTRGHLGVLAVYTLWAAPLGK